MTSISPLQLITAGFTQSETTGGITSPNDKGLFKLSDNFNSVVKNSDMTSILEYCNNLKQYSAASAKNSYTISYEEAISGKELYSTSGKKLPTTSPYSWGAVTQTEADRRKYSVAYQSLYFNEQVDTVLREPNSNIFWVQLKDGSVCFYDLDESNNARLLEIAK